MLDYQDVHRTMKTTKKTHFTMGMIWSDHNQTETQCLASNTLKWYIKVLSSLFCLNSNNTWEEYLGKHPKSTGMTVFQTLICQLVIQYSTHGDVGTS